MGKYEILPSSALYNILFIQPSTSSKINFYVKLLSNGK